MDFLTLKTYIADYPETTWMVLGVIFFLAEIFLTPGFGFLFASLAAIALGGIIMVMGEVPSLYMQIFYFFCLTIFWAILLWRPLKKWTMSKGDAYEEYVGTTAIVNDKPLVRGKFGTVKWSGAVMKARLSKNSLENEVKKGETVWVHEMKDGTLIVDVNELEN